MLGTSAGRALLAAMIICVAVIVLFMIAAPAHGRPGACKSPGDTYYAKGSFASGGVCKSPAPSYYVKEGLAAGAACLAPGIGPARGTTISESVNFGVWFMLAAFISMGVVMQHSGVGAAIGARRDWPRWLRQV